MKQLGLLRELKDVSAPVAQSLIYDPEGYSEGLDIMSRLSGRDESFSIHRGDFHALLMAKLLGKTQINNPARVAQVQSESTHAKIIFDDGHTKDYDLVVGADGVHSVARQYISFQKLNVKHGIAVRALVPRTEKDELSSNFRAWMGHGKVALTYPVKNGKWLNIASYQDDFGLEETGWSHPYSARELRQQYSCWDTVLQEILERVDDCFSWKLADSSPLESYFRGRVVLIGDAAHPMLPYLGQGANQAIADASVLASLLRNASGRAPEIQNALEEYNRIRLPVANQIQYNSRLAGDIFKKDFPNGWKGKISALKPILNGQLDRSPSHDEIC